MKKLIAIAALAALGLGAAAANADTLHRHHRADGRDAAPPMSAPTSFQNIYQGDIGSNDCEGPRVFGYCPVR